MVNKIYNNYVVFNNSNLAETYKKTLQNAGFNLIYPIYKIECFYNNNSAIANKKVNSIKVNNKEVININILKQIYKNLLSISRLQTMGLQANFLMFVTESFYESTKKLVTKLNVKNTRIYIKNEIGYNLLGAINYYNINTNAHVSCYENSITKNTKSGFLVEYKNAYSYLQNYSYNNHYLTALLNLENALNLKLSCSQNCNENLLIFRLKITNCLKTNLTLNFNMSISLAPKSLKNAVFMQNSSKWCFYQENLITKNSPVFLVGKFTKFVANKHKIFAQKTFKIPPFKTQFFYFACSKQHLNFLQNSKNFIAENNSEFTAKSNINLVKNNVSDYINLANKTFNNKKILTIKSYANFVLNSLQNLYENNGYNKIKLPKVLTKNKTLNSLINYYLPQQIIKQFIVYNFKNLFNKKTNLSQVEQDFYNLKNRVFNQKFINKNILPSNLSSLFLQNKNLYQTYINLFYFKLGIFPTFNKININPCSLLIEKNALVSLQYPYAKINILNTNLKNEVKINAISYTNLPFITISHKTQNLHLQF